MKMNKFILLFLLLGFSCKNKTGENNQQRFDKNKWAVKEGRKYPFRNLMLNDLVYTIKLKGFTKDSILNLLGEPTRTDSNYLFYLVDQTWFPEIPVPFQTKTLVIKLANDTVEWRKIKE